MPLAPGLRLGPYEVLAPLGAGGMGEVYRARDPRLQRDVAIKVLPTTFSADSERLRRFEQEARATAALSHPNILAVYDLGQHAGSPYIVSELLDGETLRDCIGARGLPVRKAVEYAVQIAHGLAAAHEKGIVHRDLKPDNVFITRDGRVKILDFGLAKLMQTEPAAAMSEPLTVPPVTSTGVVLGTVGYMAPEQVRGLAADHRTDIFALGAILYEMLSGQRAFLGNTAADTMMAILNEDPVDLTATERHIPSALLRIVHHCLEKHPAARYKSADDLAFALQGLQAPSDATQALAVPASGNNRERLVWIAALTSVTVIAAVAIALALRPVPPSPEMRVEISALPTTDPMSLAISPDGQKIVFAGTSAGQSRLWLRSLDTVSSRPLAGTDFATDPFWSPDGRSVGFFADGKLKRIDIDGASAQTLATVQTGRGGAWSREGTIIFGTTLASPLFRVSAAGGDPVAVTRLDEKQLGHGFPQFLPDGRHFLYYVRGSPEVSGVHVGQLDGSATRRLLAANAAAVYAASGHVLFVRQGTLFAQTFEPARLELTGNPFPVAEEIAMAVGGSAAVSASAAGPIAYRTGSTAGRRQLAWFDRSGNEIAKAGDSDSAERMQNPSLSPDERHVALYRRVDENTDVWLLNLGRGALSRFTFDAADEVFPIWSPDGRHIVFSSNRKARVHDLYQKAATGGNEVLLLTTPQFKHVTDWSADGRYVLFRSQDPQTGWNIWAVPLDGDRKPFPVVQTDFEERDGQFSPDGKWIAYQSNESGRFEIHVQPFSGPERQVSGKWQVSTTGGAQVRWRHDGRELFYIALDGRLMAVPIRLARDGQSIEAGAPVPLFATRVGGAVQSLNRQQYMVSSDGQRFLMNTFTEDAASPITVILNWKTKS